MAHDREGIRKAFVTTLTGLSTTSVRAYRSRVYPMDAAKLPGLIVYANSEDSEAPSMATNDQARELSVTVEGYAKTLPSVIDDTLDDIAAEIEAAVNVDRTIDGTCLTCWLESTEIEITGQAEKTTGCVKLNYIVKYRG